MIEKQVDEELVTRHLEPELPADEGEAGAELQQEAGDVRDQPALDLALFGLVAEAEKVEQVRVFERLLRQRRIGRRQARFEVGDGRALAQVQPVADVQVQRRARPA